jgi:Niemann-Pick C1 protein
VSGTSSYDAMVLLRSEVGRLMTGAFPFSFDFLFYEEIGVIDEELIKNLLICGGVVLVTIGVLIPVLRVSLLVAVSIFAAIIDVVGFLYYWDVTVSGVSTIYILICVGLAVDYSAHIAHCFKESTGDSRERARKSLGRIGPSVFNAICSTFLAVLVLAFSQSYVFRIFFKALFLVTVLAGAHGLWLLPCLLAVAGGDKHSRATGVLKARP